MTQENLLAEKVIEVRGDGQVTCLYSDDLLDLDLGPMTVTRASSVEPSRLGGWDVVLSDDPRLGADRGRCLAVGIPTREAALAYEAAWINQHVLGGNPELPGSDVRCVVPPGR